MRQKKKVWKLWYRSHAFSVDECSREIWLEEAARFSSPARECESLFGESGKEGGCPVPCRQLEQTPLPLHGRPSHTHISTPTHPTADGVRLGHGGTDANHNRCPPQACSLLSPFSSCRLLQELPKVLWLTMVLPYVYLALPTDLISPDTEQNQQRIRT